MLNRFYLQGAYFEIIETDHEILIKTFIMPNKLRNKGLGFKILNTYVFNTLKLVKIEVSDVFSSDLKRLKEFYIKCGILEENLIF